MFDSGQKPMQRAFGRAHVSLTHRSGRLALDDLHQSGCAKAFLPQIHNPIPEVVFLNTAGGVTGGDRLRYELDVAAAGRVTGTTQTAERAYKSVGDTGEITVKLSVGAGGRLDWLPQETILFDGSDLRRRTEMDLQGDAEGLMVETVVLGRKAMGETLSDLSFFDTRQIRRDGRVVFVEPLQINKATLGVRGNAAVFGDATAIATIVFVAQGAEDALGPLQQIPPDVGVSVASSAWDGKCVLRLLAADSWPLRCTVARILSQLRGQDVPRVWQM